MYFKFVVYQHETGYTTQLMSFRLKNVGFSTSLVFFVFLI